MTEKTRYSDAELEVFREVIIKKLEKARAEFLYYQEQLMNDNNSGADTSSEYLTLEDGSASSDREKLSQLAGRQKKFVDHLENALIRIQNKTYGICRDTGKLIPKERLMAVPHATLSVEAKIAQNKG
jgi:RNA polymerase-binding transcription factor DksA